MGEEIYFVIRQKSTGLLFPATGRGSTNAEFHDPGTPRLFSSRQAAQSCMDWWLKGSWKAIRTGGGSWDDYDEYVECSPRPGRLSHEYEIVKVQMSELECVPIQVSAAIAKATKTEPAR